MIILRWMDWRLLLLLYSATAYAAGDALGEAFASYTWVSIGVAAFCIILGGTTGILHRVQRELRKQGALSHPRLFISSNFFGAICGGVIALFGGESMGLSGRSIAVGMIMASFLGTVFIDRVWRSFAAQHLPTTRGEEKN